MSRLPRSSDTLTTLPCRTFAESSTWLRVSLQHYASPIHWAKASVGRFTPSSGIAGALYLAEDLTVALAETICHEAIALEPKHWWVATKDLADRALYEVTITKTITVLDITVANLAKYGLDAQIYSQRDVVKGYLWGSSWAAHIMNLGLDGILYPSRSVTSKQCLALFEHNNRNVEWRFRSSLNTDEVLILLENEFKWGII